MASQGQSLGSNSDEHGGMSFQEMLLCISSNLRAQDLQGLKFFCTSLVFNKWLESCNSASDLFDLLLA